MNPTMLGQLAPDRLLRLEVWLPRHTLRLYVSANAPLAQVGAWTRFAGVRRAYLRQPRPGVVVMDCRGAAAAGGLQ